VNRLLSELNGVLRQTVGEAIAIEMILPSNLPLAYIDRAQLETAILELVMNARDAMPRGGRILIEAAAAIGDEPLSPGDGPAMAPGPRIALSVTDTGSGMTPFVREHVFEPFFTTAGAGEGLGLGLSMVYGFVVQSGGHITLDSQVGVGTTVRLHLPLSIAPNRAKPKLTGTRR
jgi:signal transduction histidine kinase